jgi:hypothetical protein
MEYTWAKSFTVEVVFLILASSSIILNLNMWRRYTSCGEGRR